MTISSTNRKAGPFIGNDSAVDFPFTFKVFSTADVLVVRADSEGVETELDLDTDYTVALNADQDANPGGTVTLPVVLATGFTLVISSAIENLQPAQLSGALYPNVINNSLDRLTILVQQLYESVSRSLKTAITTPNGVSTQLPSPVPYALIGWNADGDGFRNSDPSGAAGLAPDLSSTASGKGAALVGYPTTGETVKDALDERLPEVGSYALLRAYSGALTAFYVRGVSNIFDGGAGVFRVDSGDTASADNGGTILVDAMGRRWKREYTGFINLKWFGALGDGSDATSEVQAALNACPVIGSTTDTPAIEYRQSGIFVPVGKYVISAQVDIPVGVSIRGETQATNYNVAGLADASLGSVFWLTATGKFKLTGKQLRGSAACIEYINFTQGQALRQAGPYAGACLEVDGAFVLSIRFCDFIELGFQTALKGTNSNGVRVHGCNFIKIGDPNNQQAMPPASGYTFGTAIDFTTCYDSFITDTFIEACGSYGAIISTNTKVNGCFIDLCRVGVRSIGVRNQIVGSSIKWNQDDGIQLVSSDGAVISGSEITGNNYASHTTSATIGFAIRFDATSSKYVTIVGNNMVDEYAGTSHAAYKTVKQAAINLGSGANTTAIIANNWASDTDAQWDATLQAQNPVLDALSRIASGFVRVNGNMLQSGGPSNERSMPYTTASGSTLGSVVKRIAYRDQNGTVLGQIPLYNSIT